MYETDFTDEFLEATKKLKKKDPVMLKRVEKKILEILANPEHYKPLRNELKGNRRVHAGSFIIIFEISGKSVIFKTFKHHDDSY